MSRKMRAKFTCDEITHRHTAVADDVNAEVLFRAVYAGDGSENDTFNKYTPWGELKMGITNPEALASLEIGKSYYLDFTPVE